MLSRAFRAVAGGVLCLVVACSSGEGDGAEGTGSDSGAASDADLTAFVNACLASSNLTRPLCECSARKAKAELSANGFAFLTASLGNDAARTEELRSRLDAQSAVAAGTFMVRGPAACAREQAGIQEGNAGP